MAKRIPLDSVCEKKISTLPSQYEGKINYVDISSIENETKQIISTQCLSAKEAPSRAKQLLEVGDILVSTVRPNLNAVAMVRQQAENLLVGSTGYCVLRCNDKVDKRYVFYFCQSPYFVDDMTSQATGASYPAVSVGIVKNSTIPFCPIEEQVAIADNFDKVSQLIILRKQQLAKLDELVKARFVELFGTIHDNKFGYEIKTLQDVCEQIKDGTHQTPTYTADSLNGYKFLSSKDVTTGKIDWTHLKYIPEELHNELYARIAPKRGDILLAKNGTTGIAAIVDRDEIFDIYVSLALLRPIEINSVYLWAAINSVETKQQFDSSLKGIGVPNLHLSEIKKTRIIVPPLEEQIQFATFVEQVDKSKLAVQQGLERLETLKKALMQKYFG